MATLHIIYDPGDMNLKGIPPDVARRHNLRQAQLSLPDIELEPADVHKAAADLIALLFPGEV